MPNQAQAMDRRKHGVSLGTKPHTIGTDRLTNHIADAHQAVYFHNEPIGTYRCILFKRYRTDRTEPYSP